MDRMQTLRRRVESEWGPIPDRAWERLKEIVGPVQTDEAEEDLLGTVSDFLSFARLYTPDGSRKRKGRSASRGKRGPYYGPLRDRLLLVANVDLLRALASVPWGDPIGRSWAGIAQALKGFGVTKTQGALQRAYWRSKARRDYEQLEGLDKEGQSQILSARCLTNLLRHRQFANKGELLACAIQGFFDVTKEVILSSECLDARAKAIAIAWVSISLAELAVDLTDSEPMAGPRSA